MQIRHLRNATMLLTLGEHRLLVDPMLSDPGAIPGFKLCGGGRRNNPLVPLPPGSAAWMASATGVLITHEHPDHLDGPGLAWIKARGLPVWASPVDAANRRKLAASTAIKGNAVTSVAVTANTGVITIAYNDKVKTGGCNVAINPSTTAGAMIWKKGTISCDSKWLPANLR